MTMKAALHEYLSGFGLTAYPDTAVPDDVIFPYLVYQVYDGGYDGETVYPTIYIWALTSSEAEIDALVKPLYDDIGPAGRLLKHDEGYLQIFRGSPWCQAVTEPNNPTIKGRYINLAVRFLNL